MVAAKLSKLDTDRWSVVTAKVDGLTSEGLTSILQQCRASAVELLIARCPATDLAAAQAMERDGFQLMDTLVYFARSLGSGTQVDAGPVPVRPVRPGEEAAVREIAAHAFQGYGGHYHADPRLDRGRCDEVYTDWAYRSCLSKDVADEVLVADLDGRVVAFATMRLNSDEEGEGVLFGVSPAAQGRGIYRTLMIRGMEWCAARGRTRMVVSTQVTNVAVQKVWTRLGFEPSRAYYTFHKWFTGSPTALTETSAPRR